MKAVLSVDPGKATGVALVILDDAGKTNIISSGEPQPEEFAEVIREAFLWVTQNKPEAFFIVCERFVINTQTVRNSQAPYSLEQIGVLKHLMRENGYSPDTELIYQLPVDAKRMFPNEALKHLQVWHRGGEGHANDALRHALLKLVKVGWVPKELLQ